MRPHQRAHRGGHPLHFVRRPVGKSAFGQPARREGVEPIGLQRAGKPRAHSEQRGQAARGGGNAPVFPASPRPGPWGRTVRKHGNTRPLRAGLRFISWKQTGRGDKNPQSFPEDPRAFGRIGKHRGHTPAADRLRGPPAGEIGEEQKEGAAALLPLFQLRFKDGGFARQQAQLDLQGDAAFPGPFQLREAQTQQVLLLSQLPRGGKKLPAPCVEGGKLVDLGAEVDAAQEAGGLDPLGVPPDDSAFQHGQLLFPSPRSSRAAKSRSSSSE